jgi:Aldehyde dehydrogenase family
MLARHPGVDKVSFAGPVSVGRRIAVACGETFKSVNLEMGGKAAAIVLEDADLAAASAALGRLAFANCGQTCFAASRVLAPRSRYDDVVTGLMEQAAAVVVGDPMAAETGMGPLVSPRRRAGVEAYVAASTGAGARVVAGGRRRRSAATTTSRRCWPGPWGTRGARRSGPSSRSSRMRANRRRWRSPARPAPGSRARCGRRTPIMAWISRGASTSGRSASTCTCRISARPGGQGQHLRPRMPRRLPAAQVGVPAGAGAGLTAVRPGA